MKSLLKTTAGWGMLLCLLGAISPAFPWSYQFGYDTVASAFAGMQSGAVKQSLIALSAFRDWHGAAISIAGGAGFLFLVATGSMKPIPWWRTLGVAVVGAAILTFTVIYSTSHWNHFPVREFGGLFAIISAAGLMFIVALEVRQLIERRA